MTLEPLLSSAVRIAAAIAVVAVSAAVAAAPIVRNSFESERWLVAQRPLTERLQSLKKNVLDTARPDWVARFLVAHFRATAMSAECGLSEKRAVRTNLPCQTAPVERTDAAQ